MNLISIKEPEKSKLPNLAIGIDLGTTNSLISIYEDNKAKIIARNKSIVAFSDNSIIVGSQILDDEFTVISSSKRLIGKNIDDIDDEIIKSSIKIEDSKNIIKYKIKNQNDITPITVASKILKNLKDQAESIISQEITHAVITVPAYFDEAAKAATKLALLSAGITPLRLINEPTAAALAYGFEKNAKGTYLIYDLGGGTFDISILRMQQGIFKVIAGIGDNMLGGDDIDKLVMDHIFKDCKTDNYSSQLEIAKELKEQLSHQDIAKLGNLSLDKNEFDNLTAPIIDKTVNMIKKLLIEKNIKYNEIDQIILVGGSSRITQIKNKLENLFGRIPLCDINPDEIVALGACLQAASMCGKIDNLLVDILPLSICIEMMGGLVEKIIERGSVIPISRTQKFTTQVDNQTSIKFHIVQGEREFASNCRSLAHFTLSNITPLPANKARITTIFQIDADGLLTITASDDSSNEIQEISVKPSYGLSEDEIEKIVVNSYEFARQDISAKNLVEAKLRLTNLLNKIDSDVVKYDSLLSLYNKSSITNSIEKVKIAVNSDNLEEISKWEENLKNILNIITELKLKEYLKKFKGRKMSDIEQIIETN